jgi:hypothetical protein
MVMETFSANQEILAVAAAKDDRSCILIEQGAFQGGERRSPFKCGFIKRIHGML